MEKPREQELREELLSSATGLMGDVLLLDCLLDRLEREDLDGWDGVVLETLLDMLSDFIREGCWETGFLARQLAEGRGLTPAG